MAASQEGGEFRSFPDLPPEARALDIGREGKPEAATAWAKAGADALAAAGFDLNLFPVADVATLNSPLAGRAFSDDPAQVASLTEAALEGCDEAGIACAPLHFPGLGSASQDTAQGPATVVTDLATLTARDLVPFQAVSRKAPAMVMSLGLYPDFDAVVPGALTPASRQTSCETTSASAASRSRTTSAPAPSPPAIRRRRPPSWRSRQESTWSRSPRRRTPTAWPRRSRRQSRTGAISRERLAQATERVIELKRELGLIDD